VAPLRAGGRGGGCPPHRRLTPAPRANTGHNVCQLRASDRRPRLRTSLSQAASGKSTDATRRDGNDGTRTRDVRRDRPAVAVSDGTRGSARSAASRAERALALVIAALDGALNSELACAARAPAHLCEQHLLERPRFLFRRQAVPVLARLTLQRPPRRPFRLKRRLGTKFQSWHFGVHELIENRLIKPCARHDSNMRTQLPSMWDSTGVGPGARVVNRRSHFLRRRVFTSFLRCEEGGRK
jgi:hypothetical protein